MKNQIKAIILDIDGVIVGNLEGINFPHPSEKIRKVLRDIHDKGIPVSFITAKPVFAAKENIKLVGIDNPHIANNGSTIFNPIQDKIIYQIVFPANDVLKIVQALPKNIYINLFSNYDYYLQKELKSNFTDQYAKIVEREPVLADIESIAKTIPVSKINIYARNDKEKGEVEKVLSKFSGYLVKWSTHPFIAPIKILNLTAKGGSKRAGVEYLLDFLKVSQEEVLGAGDTIGDWDFMEICGFKAAMGNATKELKDKIDTSDSKQIIGGHVNEDGILDIFKYFKLIN